MASLHVVEHRRGDAAGAFDVVEQHVDGARGGGQHGHGAAGELPVRAVGQRASACAVLGDHDRAGLACGLVRWVRQGACAADRQREVVGDREVRGDGGRIGQDRHRAAIAGGEGIDVGKPRDGERATSCRSGRAAGAAVGDRDYADR